MTPISRSILVTIAAMLLLGGAAACTSSSGPLGTPATPAATGLPSAEPDASDVLPSDVPASDAPAPATAAPSSGPSAPSSGGASTAPTSVPTSAPTHAPAVTPAPTTIVRAYLFLGSFTDNPGLVPVLRTVPETKAVARAAMDALLAGPNGAEMSISPAMYTTIPEGTRLLDISIADGVATVDLSKEFKAAKASFQGSSANAQVVYTLTQFPTVKLVRIEIDGVSQGGAFGRSDFQEIGLLPAIFVDRPAWGAALGNPGRVSGLANVFEARFRVQVLDAGGSVLVDQPVDASCGTGCWGRFATDVAYRVAKAQYGTLRVFDLSAKDGSPENVTEYRVWLTPAG